ncbi:Uncharacterised protein [Corynebacterium kutscheri]|uniref:Scaffolding protein n=1 Tax=Corynebacterium kutscheri TaxID=35755 RepID=A0AB38VW17_9CORY|nr:hypothetical protein [Corynebacterium kutscheri]VEH07009.1 Uncharacterised protein [Corynebacterium kutscheri]VEH79505.1 Uncharacterised protein [Corynebacterium kutscheri]
MADTTRQTTTEPELVETEHTPVDTGNEPVPQSSGTDASETAEKESGTDWKAHAKLWEKRAKDNQRAAEKLKELEDANKTELEKAYERIEELEAEKTKVATTLCRNTVAKEYNLTDEEAEMFLTGSEETMRMQAKVLAKRHRVGEDPGQGRGSNAGIDRQAIIDRAKQL